MERKSGNLPDNDASLPNKNIVNNCRQTFEGYCVFASHFIAQVVGKQRFDNVCWQTTFSSYISKSDEAFALLVFENNYDCWISMAKSSDWGSSVVKPVFTNGGNNLQTPKAANKNDRIVLGSTFLVHLHPHRDARVGPHMVSKDLMSCLV